MRILVMVRFGIILDPVFHFSLYEQYGNILQNYQTSSTYKI